MSEIVGSGQLEKLADALEELATLTTPALEHDDDAVVDDEWIDPSETEYLYAWNDLLETARSYFPPLNYVRDPETGLQLTETHESRCLELITVAPQDDPEVRLRVIYWANGQVDARAEFINPIDEGWESFFNGNLVDYDAERARNDLRFITDGLSRATELERETVLTQRESQVQSLLECEYKPEDIGDVLGLTTGTVEALIDEIDQRLDQSRRTLELIDTA